MITEEQLAAEIARLRTLIPTLAIDMSVGEWFEEINDTGRYQPNRRHYINEVCEKTVGTLVFRTVFDDGKAGGVTFGIEIDSWVLKLPPDQQKPELITELDDTKP